jgi:hypothetical protein
VWFVFNPALKSEETPPPQSVTRIDGTKFFGVIELTDDYTVRIQSDTGIQNLPVAALGKEDFQRFTSGSDRSEDGRLWSERKKALEGEKESDPARPLEIEIQLSELGPLQAVIAAYESSSGAKSAEANPSPEASPSPGAEGPEPPSPRLLFSGPGSLGVPTVPSVSGVGDAIFSPAAEGFSEALPGGITPP